MHSSDDYGYTTANSGNEFFIGLICGAAVGAAVGLLLAPKTGAEMRQTIAESADRFRRKASDTYSEASGAVNNLVEKGRSAMRRGQAKAESAMDDVASNLRSETTGTTTTY
jgi:gas vesicle protein